MRTPAKVPTRAPRRPRIPLWSMKILWILKTGGAPIARSIPIWPVAPITERFRVLTTPKEAMTIISPYTTLFDVLSIAIVRRIAGFVSVHPLAL